jgi:type I restriction enzyme R subunit
VDDPAGLLRGFKNESLPNVAVTVDLLTTGVDVLQIVNLVFLRRVRSRILYEQMLGRATRLCKDLYGPGQDKDVFRIYDAVRLYEALEPFTSMQPVVKNVALSVDQLVADLATATSEETQRLVHEQLVAALRRRLRRLERAPETFQTLGGAAPAALVDRIRAMSPAEAAAWLAERPALVDAFDRHGFGGDRVPIWPGPDGDLRVTTGFGGRTPQEYLQAFQRFLRDHLNEIPALVVVKERPRDLTRKDLRELRTALDTGGFPEKTLEAAYRETNQDIAATIIGYVRQQALGTPLVPYRERVSRAMTKILNSRPWTPPQRAWLQKIGKQLEKEIVVDRQALDSEQFLEAGGGFDRLNQRFEGKLPEVLREIHEALWQDSA